MQSKPAEQGAWMVLQLLGREKGHDGVLPVLLLSVWQALPLKTLT